ncbi:MAG: succinate-semialdehyde dehydrogenase (NADP(+)) [Maricaulis sp.]|nr:succinate-semialdehyde dehydrogenase (NADP(+)) [Maricaulis sp.]
MTALDRLNDASLLRTLSFIDGQWQSGRTRFAVHNPANREELAQVDDVGEDGAKAAIAAASQALKTWRKTSVFERGRILRRWNDLILEHASDLGVLITAEMGKPFAEAKGEVIYGAAFVDWSIEEAKRIHGETIPVPIPGSRGWTVRQPVGVVSCITPWNFPSAMVTRKCAPAMAAGCTVVLKPAPETPLSALALAVLAERAGIPKGVFNVVCGDAQAIGPVLTGSPEVRMIGFTGSTEVGKILMGEAAKGIKRVALELGGNAPFLVMDDADPEEAASGIVRGKFRAAGQTCVSPNRIIVQDGVADALIEALEAKVAAVRIGDGFETGIDVGPLIHDDAVERVDGLVRSARDAGARIVVGGQSRVDLGGSFYAPTLIEGDSFGLDLACNEIFGPIATVYRAKDEAEMIRAANDTPYGLAAYLYTNDVGRVHRISEGLDFGMIGINAPTVGAASTPFGGMKQSGIGREGGKWGVEEFTELKYVLLAGVES